MHSGRLKDPAADRKSDGERSWTVVAVIGILVAVVVPALIALGTGAWSDRPDVEASEPAPNIESARANDRPGVEAVPGQTASQPSANPEPRGGNAASSEPGSGSSVPSPPAMPAPESRSTAFRSEPQAPVPAPSTFPPVAASEPGRFDSAAATRGASGGSTPSPAMPAPEPRSPLPRGPEPQAPVPAPSSVAPVVPDQAFASATAPEAPAPSSPLHTRPSAEASGTQEATPPLSPDAGGQPRVTPPPLGRRSTRSGRIRTAVPQPQAPPAAVAPMPAPEANVPPVTPEPLTAPPPAPVQQPRASVPAPGSTAAVARVPEQASSPAAAPVPTRHRDDDRPDPEASARNAFKDAFGRVGQTRALAEAAEAPKLASGSFQAAVALQREALELSKSGRLVDASGRLVEANGLFRLAEAEARLKSVARDRSRAADAPTPAPRSSAESREAPAT